MALTQNPGAPFSRRPGGAYYIATKILTKKAVVESKEVKRVYNACTKPSKKKLAELKEVIW